MTDSILEKIATQAKEALGANLVSLLLYGSHARGEAGKGSDVNLFLVVRDSRADSLQGLMRILPDWLKSGASAPVIFQADQLDRALDSFSIEFAEMAASRRVLAGSDPFADLVPDWEGVRRELEREARQKSIALMRQWLAAGGNQKHYVRILAGTVPGYLTLIRCLLLLEKRTATNTTVEEAFTWLGSKESWFKADLWRKLKATAKGHEKLNSTELDGLMKEYLDQSGAIVKAIDEMP